MRRRFGRPNVPLLIISMLLALTLWIIVQAQNMQIKTKGMTIPLKVDNLDPKYVITDIPDSVPITIEGPGDKLDDLGLKNAQAILDLRGARLGRRTYSAIIEAPDPDINRLLPRDTSKVIVNIEAKLTKSFSVVVEPHGRISDRTLSYAGSEVEPQTVEYSGSQGRIASIAKVRVMLDLGDVDPSNSDRTFDLPVQALDVDGRSVPYVVPDASVVRIRPAVEPATVNKDLFIIPKLIGRPAQGFEVKDYKVFPEKVSVTGASLLLAQSSSIPTLPIDVNGLNKTVTIDAKLDLPAEFTLLQPSAVIVRVDIERQQLPKTAPIAHSKPPHSDPPFPDHVPPLSPAPGGKH
jgi:YbbR domain-containing protein